LERRDPSQLLEEDEDEMEVTEGAGSEEEESDSEETSASSGSEELDDPSDEEEDTELRRKIEEALRVNGIEPATGETDSEEEELMDDDQMMAIDEQLAQVFRARANEKRGKSQFFLSLFIYHVYSAADENAFLQMSMLNGKLHISKAGSLTWWTRISRRNHPVPWYCVSSPLL
jgi:hypothetical protein